MNEIKILNDSEKLITRKLWEDVFTEDSIEFLNYYYEYKCRDNIIYIIKKDNKVVAMLQRNPYVMKVNGTEVVSDYIVGVATDKDFRHKGLMSRLIKNSINDMSEQGKAFTFLMPAAEAIYTPFGFRFVYSQPVYKSTVNSREGVPENDTRVIDEKEMYVVVPMTDALFDRFSGQINRHLEQSYDVFAVRTKGYFEDLTEQYKSDGGKVCCILSEDKLAVYFSWWLTDKGAEITELICFDSDRASVITCIKDYFRKTYQVDNFVVRGEVPESCEYENRIMIRITNVQSMLELIRSDKELRIKLSVMDRLIPQNNKTFLWDVSEDESYVSVIEMEDDVLGNNTDGEYDLKAASYDPEYSLKAASYDREAFDYQLTIDIEELALWLFKGVLPESNSNLKYIRPLSKVFINEIV